MSTASRRCLRCQAELPKDSSYCLSCGCQNEDILGKSAKAEFARQEQLQSIKNRAGLTRALRNLGWISRLFGH